MAGKSRQLEPEDLVMSSTQSGNRASGCKYSAHLLLFIQLKPQVQRMFLSTIKMGLPMSVNIMKMMLYRHAQRSISRCLYVLSS